MAGKKDKAKSGKNAGSNSGSNSGEAAWKRLKAASTPLPEEAKNRHIDAPPSKAKPKAKKLEAKEPDVKKPSQSELAPEAVREKLARLHHPQAAVKRKAPPKQGPQRGIEQKAKRRLSRGALEIEARLDLHGLTQAQAHRSLIGFVSSAAAQQKKWLLVITGKGESGEGKLRGAFPGWLASPPLAQQIVEYGPAAPNHGGDGAFYVRLRRAAQP